MGDREDFSKSQWQRKCVAIRERCRCVKETVKQQSGQLIANEYRLDCNVKLLTVTGITDKVRRGIVLLVHVLLVRPIYF